MIVAVSQNTKDTYLQFRKFNLIKKELVSTILAPALVFVIGIVMLFFNVVFAILCLAIGILLPVTMYFSMYFASKKFLKGNREYFATATKYEFEQDFVTVTSASPVKEHCVKANLKYSELYRVYETSDTFYIYLVKNRCLILPKKDFTEGRPEELTALLKEKLLPLRKYVYRK